ncbi:MAG: bifunctional heptose 7-phosphate kinase/heptose 1-phosphate adenyltransferase [Flavobacteriales bacterium]
MAKASIEKAFGSFNNKNVLIVGDSMVDAYLWGAVSRISPEAPVPVVAISNRENRLGGAANVALNIIALGATPILCGVIGNDSKGGVFRDLLKKSSLSDEGIITDDKRKTTSKTRIISSAHHMLRVDEESTDNISLVTEDRLLSKIKALINEKKIDVIILEDYNKGVLTEKVIIKVIAMAKEKNIPVSVDPKKSNFFMYQGATLFKPNLKEFIEGTKIDWQGFDLETLKKQAKKFKSDLNIDKVLITLSEKGAMICGEKEIHVPAEIRNIADVSGAGDTVIAVASLALATGLSDEEIVRISNLAGGLVCEKVGVVPIDKEQLLKEASK